MGRAPSRRMTANKESDLMTAMTAERRELSRPLETLPNEKADPFYSPSNLAVLRQSIRDANEGRLTRHELIEE